MSPCKTNHGQLALSSGRVQSIVPCHRLIIKSERLSAARCMMSDPADLGSLSVNRESRPENNDSLDMPVSRRRAQYCVSFREDIRLRKFSRYCSQDAAGK